MDTDIKQPVVTTDDVLKGSKEIQVMQRNGDWKTIIVKALSWRVAVAAPFKSLDAAMIHTLENCVEREALTLLDSIIPVHLIWITNVAQQLTNGIEALKKAAAAKAATLATTTEPLPEKAAVGSPTSTPPSAN